MSHGATYLDFNATSPLSPNVRKNWDQSLEFWGNASSIHWAGRKSKTLLRETRQGLAQFLQVSPLELIFTSGGSEGNAAIVHSALHELLLQKGKEVQSLRCEFITTMVEHPSVRRAFEKVESFGFKVHWLSVNRIGEIDLEQFDRVLSEKTKLVSVMLANNETGTIFPVQELCRRAHAKGALFHTDAVQAFGKIPVSLKELNVDFATFSAHKIGALKGLGILFQKKNSNFENLISGGGQERGRRGGTENNMGIWSLYQCLPELLQTKDFEKPLSELRDNFEQQVKEKIKNVIFTAAESLRLPNTSSMVIPGVDGETLLMSLDLKGYAVSTGAACSSGNPEPSPVLLAMGLTRGEAQNSLRISIGRETTKAELEKFVDDLVVVVERLRRLADEELELGRVGRG